MAKCITPFYVTDKFTRDKIPVPCGKCPPCKKRRISGWSFRLMQEERQALSAFFVTLTYDTDHVLITNNGFMSVCKRDVQLFFKRLRFLQRHNPVQIKYYAAAEYSPKMRPHYHLLIFNSTEENIAKAWVAPPRDFPLAAATPIGHIHYGTVTGASVGYTLKYMSKECKIPMHKRDDRQKEFSLMSKGLGKCYITPAIRSYHKADMVNRMVITIEEGKKIPMPRYYKDKLYTEKQRKYICEQIALDADRRLLNYELEMEMLYGENWRHQIALSDIASFKKMYQNAEKDRNKLDRSTR